MTDLPSYDLELKAAEERRILHDSLGEFRARLHKALDITENAREHLGLACAAGTLLGLTLGWTVTGLFVSSSSRT